MAPHPSPLLETTKMRAKAEEKEIEATEPKTEEPPVSDGVAADAVFNTAELIENILIDVPFKTLLTSQRVSKQWKAAIAGSKEIQEKLFLRPAKAKGAFRKFEYLRDEYADDDDDEEDIWNFDLRTYAMEFVSLDSMHPDQKYALQASLNPLLTVISSWGYADSEDLQDPDDRADCGELITVKDEDLLAHIRHKGKYLKPSLHGNVMPSYLDMLLCQPPPTAVKLRCGGRIAIVRRQMGLRIRDIVWMCDGMNVESQASPEKFPFSDEMFLPLAGFFDIKLAGTLFHDELGEALLFCSLGDHGVEDPKTKKGVLYK